MSHCLRFASDVMTNAPLCVPTSTLTPLMPHSFLNPAFEFYENTARRRLRRDLFVLDRDIRLSRGLRAEHRCRHDERDECESGRHCPGEVEAAAQCGRDGLALAKQVARASRRERGQHR